MNAFIEPFSNEDIDIDNRRGKDKLLQQNSFVKEIGNIIEVALTQHSSIQSSDIYLINKILYSHSYRLTKAFCKIEMALAIADSVCKQLNGENSYIDNITETAKKILMPDICSF